jgi:hypothetical protein
VSGCTDFNDRRKPTLMQMEKLAIRIRPAQVSARTTGFSVTQMPQPFRKHQAAPVNEAERDK